MDENTARVIQSLADKLGTTAEHLWGVLVRQAPITATIEIGYIPVMLVLAWVGVKMLVKGKERFDEGDNEVIGMTLSIAGFIICGVAAITLIAAFCCLSTNIAGFLNPEYWALKQIIK